MPLRMGRRQGGQPAWLLAVALFCVLPCAAGHRWGTEDAIARLDRLKGEVAEQEKLVAALRKAVGGEAGSQSMTCSAHDQECHRQERRDRRRKVPCPANPLLYMASGCD
jgi:hypothetical protein